jgi:hypothetical protein
MVNPLSPDKQKRVLAHLLDECFECATVAPLLPASMEIEHLTRDQLMLCYYMLFDLDTHEHVYALAKHIEMFLIRVVDHLSAALTLESASLTDEEEFYLELIGKKIPMKFQILSECVDRAKGTIALMFHRSNSNRLNEMFTKLIKYKLENLKTLNVILGVLQSIGRQVIK